ncbi:hypothetical protein V6N11_071724 [Hibiscus sabdariffa]|uniref:RNase H type-1 domain-containing protein n=1 Tax=Hibiscus sabdariffa TaxID=183260 RepID=A0ABR2U154_9ROSI
MIDDDPSDKGGPESMVATANGSTTNPKHAGSMASSYKESLMQNSTIIPSESDEIIEEEEIIIEEGEVKSLERTVVVKLLGRRIGYTTLRSKIYEIWKPSQPLKLMDVENDYFLVSFRSQDDYERILSSESCPLTRQPFFAEENAMSPVTNQQQAEDCSFGPWMMVERKQRKPATKQVNHSKGLANMIFQGSRFNMLSEPKNGVNHTHDILTAPLTDVPIQQSKHSAIVVDENLDPNILVLPGSTPTTGTEPPAGEPPDKQMLPTTGVEPHAPVGTSLQSNQTDETSAWSLGSGSSINPLTDVWILAIGPLHHHLKPEALLFPVGSFTELLNRSRNRDRDRFCDTFHPEVVPHILGVQCPDSSDIPDQIIWRWTAKGNFEIQSAYSLLTYDSWDPNNALWKHIWKMPMPQRLRVFFAADESILHVLRDCRVSFVVWEQLLPSSISIRFFNLNLLDWIMGNLCSRLLHTEWDIPWSIIFVSTIWQLWKSRNDLVFNSVMHSSEVLVHRAITWARYYSGCCPTRNHLDVPICEPVTWRRPDPGWICLNVDGAVSMGLSAGAIGGLYRDHSGSWIVGFMTLQVQIDCKEVVTLFNALKVDRSTFPFVRAIVKLRRKCWMTDIIWIPRDGNQAADMLAKLTVSSALDMVKLFALSRCLIPLLQSDAPDVSFTQT